MDKPGTIARPPLGIWVCLVLVVAGLLMRIYAEDKKMFRARNEAIDKTLLDQWVKAGPGPVVLVIGTSLVQSGLDSTGRICRCVAESTGKKIVLLKCWLSGGDLARISRNHEALFRKLKPSVVLVETNLLFYRPAGPPVTSLFAQTFRDLINGWDAPVYDPDERARVLPGDRTAIETARAGLVDSTDLLGFRGICSEWQRGGTRIGLVNIPLEKNLENKKWLSVDTAGFLANLRFLRRTGPVNVYDAGLQLDSAYFFDFAHLNRKGNDVFAPWFCRLLSSEVNQLATVGKTRVE